MLQHRKHLRYAGLHRAIEPSDAEPAPIHTDRKCNTGHGCRQQLARMPGRGARNGAGHDRGLHHWSWIKTLLTIDLDRTSDRLGCASTGITGRHLPGALYLKLCPDAVALDRVNLTALQLPSRLVDGLRHDLSLIGLVFPHDVINESLPMTPHRIRRGIHDHAATTIGALNKGAEE